MTASLPWILWLAANLALLLSTRNPIYLLLNLTGLFLTGNMLAQKRTQTSWVQQNLRFLLTMILLSTLINTLFSHTGATVLFSLPETWPLVGGDITLESMVYGAINGVIIGALYLTFNILNLALSIKQIIRLIPRAFYPAAMIVTVALTFFPSIQERAREIKEAQMIRGSKMKKVTDWLPILIPLLVTSLERAFLLSESMTSRGFHAHQESRHSRLAIVGLTLAAFCIFSGWVFTMYDYPKWVTFCLFGVGGSFFLILLILLGRQTRVTHFHQESWHIKDILGTVLFSSSLIVFIALRLSNQLESLSYSPYMALSPPTFQWGCLLFCASSLFPIFLKSND